MPERARDGLNVLGRPLTECGQRPLTGFYRNGCCDTGAEDTGMHTVCAIMTEAFLTYTRAQGNDLSTPRNGFPGLQTGDRWCVCAGRWLEAEQHGVAPPVVLAATHQATLSLVSLEVLLAHAADVATDA